MEDQLILVNLKDEAIGKANKLEAHQQCRLHRAFSVFLYHDGKMLIQKRAKEKYHSGGLWANTCCSHPRVGEELIESVKRRLLEEANILCPVHEITSFIYKEHFPETGLSEYELDHIFVGHYNGSFQCNPEEASEMKYVDLEELSQDLVQNPLNYSAWFITAFPIVYNYIKGNDGGSV